MGRPTFVISKKRKEIVLKRQQIIYPSEYLNGSNIDLATVKMKIHMNYIEWFRLFSGGSFLFYFSLLLLGLHSDKGTIEIIPTLGVNFASATLFTKI